MQYFGIQFTDHDVEVNEVEEAVRKEISAFAERDIHGASNYLVQKRQIAQRYTRSIQSLKA